MDNSTARIQRRLIQVGGVMLLLLAFLAIFAILFFQFRAATLQSITAASDSFGDYVDSVMDRTNTNIHTSAMQMFYTSSIRTLRTSDDLTWSERTIGHRDLGNFASSSNFIDHVMVYNQDLDTVFTSESSYGSARSGDFHDQQVVEILLHPEHHPYLVPFKRQDGGATFYSFLFYEDNSSGFSSMLLDINASWYEDQLLGTLSRDRHIIVDQAGEPIIPGDIAMDLPPWPVFEAAFAASPGSGYVLPDRSPFLSSCWVYHQLGRAGWYYLEAFQLEVTAPGLVRVQRAVFVMFALLCVVLLLLFAYLLVYIIPTFLHISRALTTVELEGKDSAEKFDELLSSHRAYATSRKLQELQAGSFPSDTQPPIVMVCAPEPSKKLSNLLLAHPDAMVADHELGPAFVLPACTNKGRNNLLPAIREAAAGGPVYVSLPCYSGQQLVEAFSALEELARLAFVYPTQSVFCQELLAECNQTSGFSAETVAAMETALKKGQLQVAQAQWLLLLDQVGRDRYNDLSFAIHYLDKMLSGLQIKYGLEPTPPIDASLGSLLELQQAVDQRLRRITDAVAASQRQMADSLCGAVWGRIYELYHDADCCSQMIAEQLDMSPSYLNRQFRSSTGMSINDAIQHVRIDKACKLLRQSDDPVEQVAKQAGYQNIKYFFVLFKKYTGKTPSQFRSELPAGKETQPVS